MTNMAVYTDNWADFSSHVVNIFLPMTKTSTAMISRAGLDQLLLGQALSLFLGGGWLGGLLWSFSI